MNNMFILGSAHKCHSIEMYYMKKICTFEHLNEESKWHQHYVGLHCLYFGMLRRSRHKQR